MSDMELVIKISKEDYEIMKHNVAANNPLCPLREAEMVSIVANGTPLPKGHGRLIDADELKSLSYEVLLDTDNPNRADGLSVANGVVEEDIDLAPTIIEADKAESEDEE